MFRLVGSLFGGAGTVGASAAPAVQPTLAAAAVEEQCGQALRFHASAGERTDGVEGDRQPPSPLLRVNGETRPLPLRASPRRVQVAGAAVVDPARPPAASRARQVLKLGALRTAAALFAAKGAVALPPGFPSGPFASHDEAKMEIAAFSRDTATAGGGHGVVWGKLEPGCSTHGPHRTLLCHQHGAANGACKWRLTLEQCEDGWCLYSQYGVHNHELASTVAEANAHRGMRDIPADLLQIAKDMVSSGIPVAGADRFLRHQVTIYGDEPTWTYMDVYHATGASTRQRAMDASGFSELLFEREHKQGLFHRKKTDADGCLSHAFFVMPGADEIYAIAPESNVVLYDTKARCALTCPPARSLPRHCHARCPPLPSRFGTWPPQYSLPASHVTARSTERTMRASRWPPG